MPDSIWLPGQLDAIEEEYDRAIAEDRKSDSSVSDTPIWETDAGLDELYRALAAAERRKDAANVAMGAAEDAGDDDAWDRAASEYDDCSDMIGAIKSRIWELEENDGFGELREQRRDYYSAVL